MQAEWGNHSFDTLANLPTDLSYYSNVWFSKPDRSRRFSEKAVSSTGRTIPSFLYYLSFLSDSQNFEQ
jgi:hypothetical protein